MAQRLHAKALAIGDETTGGAAVLVTVDNLGVPATLVEEVASRLEKSDHLERTRLAVVGLPHAYRPVSDRRGPPALRDADSGGSSGGDRPLHGLPDRPDRAGRPQALADREPATLRLATGSAPFAANRRVLKDGKWVGFGVTPGAPVQHVMPVLGGRWPGRRPPSHSGELCLPLHDVDRRIQSGARRLGRLGTG